MTVTLDVWSDMVCPWCFIGKRRLAAALEQEEPGSVEVRWHAFQLQPDIPLEGADAEPYFNAKFGGPERVAEMHQRVTDIAAADGLEFHMERQKRAPNTLLAHRAVKLAADPAAAVEALFTAHFVDGEDIGDRDTILRLVPDLDPAALDRGDGAEAVAEDLRMAGEIGINGVPFFVGAMRVAVSGAQDPEVLRQLLAEARERAAA
ncbi:MAG: oxidoreductase [Solirubrobacterales bacterium]|jgi:predicted DsbA family dithiol-disulfide isomerase|nr:oxidoreductase [Solirubrobacterales bacterium]